MPDSVHPLVAVALAYTGRAVSIGLLVGILLFAFVRLPELNSIRLVIVAGLTVLATVLLFRTASADEMSFRWGPLSAVVFLAGSIILDHGFEKLYLECLVAIGVMLLVEFYSAIYNLLASTSVEAAKPSMTVFAFVCLTSSSIIWLGPLAEIFPREEWLVNGIIALNPLSYLSELAEIDYLRSSWFYRFTPFGGLKYHYPDPFLTSIFLITGIILLHLLARKSGYSVKAVTTRHL